MTANQIAYWKNEESKRHNLATETEEHRSNVEEERNRRALEDSQIAANQAKAWNYTMRGLNEGAKLFGSIGTSIASALI